MVSAWYGGLGPGLLATALGALGAGFFFLPPSDSFLGTSSVAVPLGLFLLEGTLISSLIAALRSAKSRAEENALRVQSHQDDLRRSEEWFRATFEQAAVGIAHVGTDGRWLRVNQKFCDIVGYAHEELLEHTFQEITYPDGLDADLGYVRQLLQRVAVVVNR